MTNRIESLIYIIRDERVVLNQDLAELYQVETKVLVQAVQRATGVLLVRGYSSEAPGQEPPQ